MNPNTSTANNKILKIPKCNVKVGKRIASKLEIVYIGINSKIASANI